jgi:hypothetical protein
MKALLKTMFEKNYRLQDIQLSKSLKRSQLVAAAFQYNSLCPVHLRTARFGGQPSPCSRAGLPTVARAAGEGWWRIPGSNR